MGDLDAALYSLDPAMDRGDWFKVLAAYKSGGGDRETAQSWSAQADNYTPDGFRDTWRSINPNGGYTEKTLFYMAKQKGWEFKRPRVPATPLKVSCTAQYARQLWLKSHWMEISDHAYARRKGISDSFGVKRGFASGRVIGRDADCLIVPNRNWDGAVIGVECINSEGKKQTFGSKGILILGHPEGARIIHVCEGWATMWACFQLFPRPHGGVVAFGSQLDKIAEEAGRQFTGKVAVHVETGNRDVWDYWKSEESERYVASVMEAFHG